MGDGKGFASDEAQDTTRRRRIVPALLAAALLAALAGYLAPRATEAIALLTAQDDPVRLADHVLDKKFNAALAEREIEQALAKGDADLAQSFVDLARARDAALDSALTDKVKAAVAEENSTRHALKSFAMGFVGGEPDDMASLAGTTVGDLFVFGDIRDAVREGSRMALGQKTDTLILGLACVGLAITAGTYATLGAEAPVRVGLSLAKAARKTGRLSAELASSIGRMMRGVVDGRRLKTAVKSVSFTQPQLAMRGAREAVKVERAGGLMHLARDVGRVQTKAGTRAALDGLKVAESPREMARVAKLAEKQGSRTRAILKVAGRGAIMLSLGAFNLAWWIVGAAFAVFGFVSSLKSAAERMTERALRRRKRRRWREQQRFAAMVAARG